jgi:putative aldouronate transport system permease protein
MAIRESAGSRIFDNFNVVMMVCLIIVTLYPFLYVTFASVSEPLKMTAHSGLLLWPKGINFSSYKAVFENPNILQGYKNTIFYVVVGTGVNLLLTSFGAYALSRHRIYLQNTIMFIIVFTMLFNGGLIPLFLVVRGMGLVDSRWAVIFPRAMDAFFLIIMRTYFNGLPDSLEDSAKLDGANDFTILFRIIIPVAMPVVAVMVLYYGVKNWNTWFNPMIFLRRRTLYPLQLILREILIVNATDEMTVGAADADREAIGATIKYATIMVATVPILMVYPMLQKYFVKGVMIGAIKG